MVLGHSCFPRQISTFATWLGFLSMLTQFFSTVTAFDYIQTRNDLKTVLREQMEDSYEEVKEEQELDEGNTYLKTYLIESNRDMFFEGTNSIGDRQIYVETTKDPGFIKAKTREKDSRVNLYIDKLDDRFWSIHTLATSDISDRVVGNLIYPRFTDLDHSWLASQFLEGIGKAREATFRAFSVKYRDKFKEVVGGQEDRVEGLSMRLWGETASEVLETLKSDNNISKSTTLSNVGIRKEYHEKRLLSDITYKSRFTVRGESIEGHFRHLRDIMGDYSESLEKIEEEFSMHTDKRASGTFIGGEPIFIDFDRPIRDLEGFVDELFSSTQPFRLWGLKDEIEDDYYNIAGVDLHTGDKVTFEVSPDWMRVYLPENSCGNIILRLYTNIQHYFDSKASLSGGGNEQII